MRYRLQEKTSHYWTILPCFLIRSTGFPFEWLDALRMSESDRQCRQLLSAQALIDKLQAEFDKNLFPQIIEREQIGGAEPPIFRRWYKLNQLVRQKKVCSATLQQTLCERIPEIGGWLDGWHEALAAVDGCQQSYQQQFDDELQRSRAALYDVVQDERFQEALFLSNPMMYTTALPSYLRRYQPEQRPSKMRYLERQLYAYLQRFCAKNDTTSFFGPIDYGWYDPEASAPLNLVRQPSQMPRRRLSRLAYWAAQALSDTVAAEPTIQPYLILRWQDGCIWRPPNLLHITSRNQFVRLPEALADILPIINGRNNSQTICQEVGADVWRQLQRLISKDLLQLNLRIPTAVFDPLSWLHDWVDNLPLDCPGRTIWLPRLASFQRLIARFATASVADKQVILQELETNFSELTQQTARRGEAEIYADRFLVYDEAQGDIITCAANSNLQAQILTRLTPTLDLCASYSLLIQSACQRKAHATFMAMGQGNPVPYLAFVHRLDQETSLQDCLNDSNVQAFEEQLVKVAAASEQTDGIIRIEAADIEPLLQPIPPGTMISPDIFLSAVTPHAISTGNYQLVIGEIHYGAQVWCHFLSFCHQQPKLAATLKAMLPPPAAGHQRADMVYGRYQGKTFYLELPGKSVEVLGRSLKAAAEVLPVAELEVVLRDGKLTLLAHGQPIQRYPGDPRSVSNWLFGPPSIIIPPLLLGRQTPRIELAGATFKRATWHLPTADWLPTQKLNHHELMQHCCRLRQQEQLPEQGFVRLSGERKPFYLDFTNQISLEFFLAMIRDKPTFTLTELLPSVSHWWLKEPYGTRSCEWRMTMIYGEKEALDYA